MPVETKCCLCVVAREEFKSLYDESGQGNDVYDITLKYFDPMILSPYHERDSAVICAQCWRHISEFYSFQQSILQTHAKLQNLLQNDIEQDVVSEVKLEDYILCDMEVVDTTTNDVCKLDNLKDANESLELDNHDVRDENPVSSTSDDEKPLITYVTKAKKKTKVAINVQKKTNDHGRNKSVMVQTIKENVVRVPKTGCKANTKLQAETLPDEGNADTQSMDEENLNASASNVVRVPKTGCKAYTKLQSKTDAETLPHEGNADTQSMGAENFNASNNEVGEGATGSTSNREKKSKKDKRLEADAFIAQWKQELECAYCTTVVSKFELLTHHYRAVHPNKKCYVVCCERKFYYRCNLAEHIRFHINPSAFKCDECGKCCTTSRNLTKHKNQMHSEEARQFECDICYKRFAKKTILSTHMEVHEKSRDHICSECGKGFPTENRRKDHERRIHQADRNWPCNQCNVILRSRFGLKRHKLITHHDGSTVFICSVCGKIFTSEFGLRAHKRIVHVIERKFKCNMCEKAFKTPTNLREHMATHTGVDLYQCSHCPKTFKCNVSMYKHRKRYHPKEWAEAPVHKPESKKVDNSLVLYEIIM